MGTMAEVVKDCCGSCPPIPPDVDPTTLEPFVSGPLKWVVDNPGRARAASLCCFSLLGLRHRGVTAPLPPL